MANYHSSLLILSYLYNALCQKHLLYVEWPDLDTAMIAHEKPLFFGSRPRTSKDIAMRFALRQGLSLAAYLDLDPKFRKGPEPDQSMIKTRTGGEHKSNNKSRLDGNCLKMTPTSQALVQYYDCSEKDLIKTVHRIDAIEDKDVLERHKYIPPYRL